MLLSSMLKQMVILNFHLGLPTRFLLLAIVIVVFSSAEPWAI